MQLKSGLLEHSLTSIFVGTVRPEVIQESVKERLREYRGRDTPFPLLTLVLCDALKRRAYSSNIFSLYPSPPTPLFFFCILRREMPKIKITVRELLRPGCPDRTLLSMPF
jgi:hypothetical protein